jgi:8-amino-7-oxononanoate synthase
VTQPLAETHPIARIDGDGQLGKLRELRESGLMPYFRLAESTVAAETVVEGRPRIMLGSANYLGLADHPEVIRGAREAIDRYGSTITGSRLLNGSTRLHAELEEEIADWQATDAAVVFTTGYQANVGTISSLLGPGDTVVVDSAAHASLLDGCVLSRAKTRAFLHDRMDLLEEALEKARRDGGAVLVVVDGVYSMEGDLARLDEVLPLCERYGAALMVDEAHATGVLGARGVGAAELYDVEARVDVRMGALSKALGSAGGFIAGSEDLVDFLKTNARAFLFTTAAVPAALGAALAALRVRRSSEGDELAHAALDNARHLWNGLHSLGLALGEPTRVRGAGEPVVTPIVSVVIGDDAAATRWWQGLFERGVFTSAAIHPAVPPRRALLRLCVMATHDRDQLDRTIAAFAEVKAELERGE